MPHDSPLDVFVIEDDFDTSENLRDILELDGHRVALAHSAAEAVASGSLRTASVILLDWKLPDATALDVLPQLHALAPETDVIIVTGHGDFDNAVSALREGAADYLLKPINPQALRGSLQRLAERRWLTAEKSRSEANFRNLVRAAPCVIVILNRDQSIAYFSPFAEQLTAYAAAEAISQNFVDLFIPEHDRTQVAAIIDKVFTQQSERSHESAIQCRDGTIRWLIWNAQLFEDVDREPKILAVGQDVTEHKRAAEQLLQSERLAAIGEAMAGLAHESRNALQRSQAFLELLSIEVSDRPEALKLVDRIQEAQNHLHQLYEEVRQYAAPMNIEMHPHVLEELLEETWCYLEHERTQRNVELVLEQSCDDSTCLVDRFMMQQVFRNILENSLAACPDPVRIQVRCRSFQDEHQEWVEVSIRDNGPGLNTEQRKRIFEPFYTTKTRGTGLGMTLCQRIVAAHSGKIAIGPGPGTQTLISLPRAAVAKSASLATPANA